MKTGLLSKLTTSIKEQVPRKKKQWELMVIPFVKELPKYVSKDEHLTIQMRSKPNDVESIKYKIKT